MNELQKYNVELERAWNELYHVLNDKSSTEEMTINKKALVVRLLSLIENRLKDLNTIRKDLVQQLNHITEITNATRLSENEMMVQKIAGVLALLDDVDEL